MLLVKERLLYLLQPPLESLFANRELHLRLRPYAYQMEGIAFLMPRCAALLADEMGLGKTMQAVLALRLLFHAGLIQKVLVICPKPLLNNWLHELHLWAGDIPIDVVAGDYLARRAAWLISNSPLKLANYEILTRDAGLLAESASSFDLVVLDEAQRIKNRQSKTSKAVRSVKRQRSWALTGTPVENHSEDLVNLFAFIDPGRIPPETPAKQLRALTADCVLRRTKEEVLTDLPDRTTRDTYVQLTAPQWEAYIRAEREGTVYLNGLGNKITVSHVFDLILRLKQICNFDPRTGASGKLEQLHADLEEVVDSNRKAIVFSQWVEPLDFMARALAALGVLQFHGRVPSGQRSQILTQFQSDSQKHVLLMSYGTGSVGLNLQCANYVFLFDRWWNPAVEDQAIHRVHRIGQRQPVFVTRFITPDTIEARIAAILDRKREIFQELIGESLIPPTRFLTEEEIFSLFEIQARPDRDAA
jgi:SNF2 family DNA or RNA helicase